jgi:CHAT domain-containing protein/tetratricopeptide (TPR) repeat protein
MVISNRVKIVFILVFFLGGFGFNREKPVDEDNNKKLRKEILAAYRAGAEQALLDFVRKKKDKISHQFIVDFAKAGVNERKEEWLKVCEIIAKEKKDNKTTAYVFYKTGSYFRLISENKKAVDYFDKALVIYLKLNDPVALGYVYLGKGHIYLWGRDNSRALEMYDKALTFFEKAGTPGGQGSVYVHKGYIYYKFGEYSRAREMFDKAMLFFEKAGNPVGQGDVYLHKGFIYSKAFDNSNALEMFDQALPFYKKAETPLGQGYVYLNKGYIYSTIGKYSNAFEMYEKALTLFEKARQPDGQAEVYMSKVEIYLKFGENSKALEMVEKALTFFEKAGNTNGVAAVYLEKGFIYSIGGEYSRALPMLDKALVIFEKTGELNGLANVYWDKGNIYFYTGENSRALEMYDKALAFYEKAVNPADQGSVYQGKAKVYSKTGKNSQALEMFDQALLLFRKAGDIEAESAALHGKATVLAKLGKRDEALPLFEKSIAVLEKVRAQTAFPEMKLTFLEKVYDHYQETVRFMLENKHDEKGFKYAESMRARLFLDRMAEGLVSLEKGLTPGLKEKQDQLVAKLSFLSKEMHKAAGEKNDIKLNRIKEQYRNTGNEFADLLVKIRLNNPLYAAVRYPEPITVRALQTRVLKKGELLLRFFISPNQLYVFIVTRGSFSVVPITFKEEEIKRLVKRYLTAVEENSSRGINRYSKTLYEKLFKPLENTIKENNDIIIVPDGELARVPFEAFIIDKDQSGRPVFLLEKYRVKYIQSASLLSILREHYCRDGSRKSFIGFGDPVYDYENFKQGKPELGAPVRAPGKGNEIREMYRGCYARAGGIMNRLPRSGEEVETIGRLFKNQAQKWVVYSRDQAREDRAKGVEMKDFDFIHFACHGILNDDFQSLVLSQLPAEQYGEDGYFTVNEIMNCDYRAQLVVLSACQTGTGKIERTEGVTGLTRAVMYAGTPAVAASLWKVDDTAAKELMIEFYRNMLEKNLDKTEALRQAKLDLLKNKKYRSPLFWSAFVMYGE